MPGNNSAFSADVPTSPGGVVIVVDSSSSHVKSPPSLWVSLAPPPLFHRPSLDQEVATLFVNWESVNEPGQ